MFRRVAVFAGGWTLEAASDVCSDDTIESWDILDLLAALVDKSMVVAELGESDQRYRLLESTRQYALEKLTESGERDHLRNRHAAYVFQMMQQAAEELHTRPMGAWVVPLAPEIDNIRLALDWFLAERHDTEKGALLVALSYEFFQETSRPAELWRWSEIALESLGPAGRPDLRAPLLRVMAEVSSALGKGLTQRQTLGLEALALYRASNDRLGTARALISVGARYVFFGNLEKGRPMLDEALGLARGGKIAGCSPTRWRSRRMRWSRTLEERRALLSEAISIYRAAGDERSTARVLSWLAEQEFQRRRGRRGD